MTKSNLGQAIDKEFKNGLRHLLDRCEFNSLARIGLVSQWLMDEYRIIAEYLGVAVGDDAELDDHFAALRTGDIGLPEDLNAYYQLGLDPPDSVSEQTAKGEDEVAQ